jgi:thiol:disulfide interchange protein DsbD
MKKSLYLLFLLMSTSAIVFAQHQQHLSWKLSSKKFNDTAIELTYTTTIPDGWHVYAADEAEGLLGPVTEKTDAAIQLNAPAFTSKMVNIKDPIFDNASKNVYTGSLAIKQLIHLNNKDVKAFKIKLSYEWANQENFLSNDTTFKIVIDASAAANGQFKMRLDIGDVPDNNASKSLMAIFILGFLGGIISWWTPCVFPMIPLTVSFFTKKSVTRRKGIINAFFYGLSIFLIYILLSLPFHFISTLNPEFLNNVSTSPTLNIILFAVLLVFAFSFFGYYEISLPARFSTGADKKAGLGNFMGIFFMALTLAIVSFSCTGPILGSLLAGSLSSDAGAMQLSFGMGGFGLALALPFTIFALFPNLLNALPKSGGWLNSVKVVLGFLEIAFAIKFLSQADLTLQWGLLKREIFIGIWILVGIGLTAYLAGWIKFKHDSPVTKLSPFRKVITILVGAFTIYLIPGITNTSWANLSLISGFPPPLDYSIYHHEKQNVKSEEDEGTYGFAVGRDFQRSFDLAKSLKKPLLIDFTGFACVNCRRMEESVWTDTDVKKMISEHFVIVSLYVDDKRALPADQQFTYTTKTGAKKEIVTYGDLYATFQTENFNSNSQPLYAIINNEEKLMNGTVGYTPDPAEFLKWLQEGLDKFNKRK